MHVCDPAISLRKKLNRNIVIKFAGSNDIIDDDSLMLSVVGSSIEHGSRKGDNAFVVNAISCALHSGKAAGAVPWREFLLILN